MLVVDIFSILLGTPLLFKVFELLIDFYFVGPYTYLSVKSKNSKEWNKRK